MVLVTGIGASGQFVGPNPQPKRRKAEVKPRPCTDLAGEPLNLSDVITALVAPERKQCIAGQVEKRGVSFQRTALITDTLRGLSAPPELIRLIPETPPPAKPAYAGPLTIACQPANCEIVVNDRYYGEAKQGEKTIDGLPAGPTVLRVSGSLMEAEVRNTDLPPEAAHREAFALRPVAEIRSAAGRDLLNRTIRALGGVEGLNTMAEFEGRGTVEVKTGDSDPQEWTLNFQQKWDEVSLRLVRQKGECTATIHTGPAEATCKGKLRGSPDEVQAARIALSFHRSQLAAALGRLVTANVTSASGTKAAFQAETDGASYRVEVGEQNLPVEMIYRPRKDVPPVKAEFSDYTEMEDTRFPQQIVLTEPDDGKDRSTVFRFSEVKSQRTQSARKGR
jgi:hypothetical protein